MPRRSTDYDKLVSKHYSELSAALESIRRQLKPAYMWELTAENCHQIYSRLLKIDNPFSGAEATGDTATGASSMAFPSWLTVIELHPHNSPNNSEESGTSATDGSIAFFGSIPQILANIDSLLSELQPAATTTADDGAPNNHGRNQNEADAEKNNKGVFEDVDSSNSNNSGGGNSFFIDVSCSATVPRIMQDKEETVVALKYLLLRVRDYLSANTGARCLNANDCLRRTMPASGGGGGAQDEHHHCWDLCFLSGVLLGYPVILCNSTPEEGNCLAHQALVNYTVSQDGESRLTLYSFSVPQRFQSHFSNRINRWFEELRQREERLRLLQTVETHALILT